MKGSAGPAQGAVSLRSAAGEGRTPCSPLRDLRRYTHIKSLRGAFRAGMEMVPRKAVSHAFRSRFYGGEERFFIPFWRNFAKNIITILSGDK